MSTSINEAPGGRGSNTVPARPIGELVFAGIIACVGVVGFVAGSQIPIPPSAGVVGPRVFPYLVSGIMVVIGIALVIQLLRGHTGAAEEGEDIDPDVKTDWLTVAKLVGFLAIHIAIIVPLGWPVAAAVLFFGAAWSLGAKPWWRNAVIAIVLALVLQFVFAGLLGVSLPPGFLLEGVEIFNG